MRPDDRSRPCDLVVLDFADGRRNLVFDGVISTVYRSTILPKVAVILGFATKQVVDKKLKADADSLHPVSSLHGGRHRLIPYDMEDGGRTGAHGQATLRMFAEFALAKEKLPPTFARAAPLSPLKLSQCGHAVGIRGYLSGFT